jgi:Holliday junction resolvase
MTNSRAKGAAGERELANKLKEHGFTARRTQQFCGTAGDSDVICTELAQFHIECKRVQNLNVDKAIDMHRKNNRPWLVTMFLEDWIALVKKSSV